MTAQDRVDFPYEAGGQSWLVSWHPPENPPDGRPHGSSAVCLTPEGGVVFIAEHPEAWNLPGGRPELGEDWRAVLDREVLEEACARVTAARLLGFTRSICVRGHELGLVRVRAQWLADVVLEPWEPEFETVARTVVTKDEARSIVLGYWERETGSRLLRETGLA